MRPLLRFVVAIAVAALPALPAPVFFAGTGGPLADFDSGSLTPGTVSFTISVPDTAPILSDVGNVRVRLIGLDHTFASDLEVTLTFEPMGVTRPLFSQIGLPGTFSAANFFGNYDFASSNSNDLWGSALALGDVDDIPMLAYFPTSAGSALPNDFSLAFAGLVPTGNWRLTITDFAPGDSGELLGWELILDLDTTVPEPSTGMLVLPALGAVILAARRKRMRRGSKAEGLRAP